MTVMKMVTVYDQVAMAHSTPKFFRSHGEAVRSLADAVNGSDDNAIKLHPEDYVMFDVGEYNEETGDVCGYTDGPQKIVSALALKRDFRQMSESEWQDNSDVSQNGVVKNENA